MNRYTCIISDGDGLGVGLCRPIGNVMQGVNLRDVGPYVTDHVKKVGGCLYVNSVEFWPPAPTMGPGDVFVPGSITRVRSAFYLTRLSQYIDSIREKVDLARSQLPSALIGVYHEDFPLRPGKGLAYGGDPTANDADHARLVRLGLCAGTDFTLVSAYLHKDLRGMTPTAAAEFVAGTIRNAAAFGPIKIALQPFYGQNANDTDAPIPLPLKTWDAMVGEVDGSGVDRVCWVGKSNRATLAVVKEHVKRFE